MGHHAWIAIKICFYDNSFQLYPTEHGDSEMPEMFHQCSIEWMYRFGWEAIQLVWSRCDANQWRPIDVNRILYGQQSTLFALIRRKRRCFHLHKRLLWLRSIDLNYYFFIDHPFDSCKNLLYAIA